MIEVLGIKNADKLVPTKDDIKPADPVSENMAVLIGKPIKAFIYQDHDAHIATHQAFLQDPQIAAFIGQNPAAQQIVAALQAHIAEHIAFQLQTANGSEGWSGATATRRRDSRRDIEETSETMAQAGNNLLNKNKLLQPNKPHNNKLKTLLSRCSSKKCSLKLQNNSVKL